jgi:hypothetical protein
MRVNKLLVIPLAVAAVGLGALPASAANTPDNAQGKHEQGLPHSNSICAASGLNDEPLDEVEGGRVQSYGQIIRFTGALKTEDGRAIPGQECNAHLMPWPEAFIPPAP